MNAHPDASLAAYVDGDIDPAERAAVDEHLTGCDRCREEIRLAVEARDALRGVPEMDAPPGIPMAVRRAARREPSHWSRRLGVAAVAAAVIAAGVIAVSRIDFATEQATPGGGQAPAPRTQEGEAGGGGGGDVPEADAPAEDALFAESSAPAPLFTETDRQYDTSSLPELGRRFRDRARSAIRAGLAPTADEFFELFDVAELAEPARRAFRCVLAEVPPDQVVVPFVIEGATFDGRPAYVAAFLQGPSPDQPYDRVLIWVANRRSCSLLSLASQRL